MAQNTGLRGGPISRGAATPPTFHAYVTTVVSQNRTCPVLRLTGSTVLQPLRYCSFSCYDVAVLDWSLLVFVVNVQGYALFCYSPARLYSL